MDPIRKEKLRAMIKYESQFFNNLMLYSLTVLTCSLFCSYPFWFPSLCSSVRNFLFISLPNVWSFFSNPKCLFIVGNAIVIFLIGESKLSSSHSPAPEIYDEYVARSRTLRGLSTLKDKKEERKLETNLIEESVNRVEEDQDDDDDGDGGADEERDGEEETGLPVEELNKRVEEFIARVNKQRWLEAKSLVRTSSVHD